MSDSTRDRVEGKVDELKGRGKSAVGDLTGDSDTRAEGDLDQAKGKIKQGVADIKDKVSDIADRLKGDDDKK
ncbi:hypothetical protein BH09CHL1_BH09CHL1_00840 [soil metagenome]